MISLFEPPKPSLTERFVVWLLLEDFRPPDWWLIKTACTFTHHTQRLTGILKYQMYRVAWVAWTVLVIGRAYEPPASALVVGMTIGGSLLFLAFQLFEIVPRLKREQALADEFHKPVINHVLLTRFGFAVRVGLFLLLLARWCILMLLSQNDDILSIAQVASMFAAVIICMLPAWPRMPGPAKMAFEWLLAQPQTT